MCKCISYNCPEDYQTEPSVVCYDKKNTGKEYVEIDACIVPDIKKLWKENIFTFGCCCSHNGRFGKPSVVVKQSQINKCIKLLPHFNIFYWDDNLPTIQRIKAKI